MTGSTGSGVARMAGGSGLAFATSRTGSGAGVATTGFAVVRGVLAGVFTGGAGGGSTTTTASAAFAAAATGPGSGAGVAATGSAATGATDGISGPAGPDAGTSPVVASTAGTSASDAATSASGPLSTILIRLRAARSAFGFGVPTAPSAGGVGRGVCRTISVFGAWVFPVRIAWAVPGSRTDSADFTSTPIPCRRKRTSLGGLPIIRASSATVNFADIVFTSRGSPSPARLPRARSPSLPWRPRLRPRRFPRTRRSRRALPSLPSLRRPRPR